jgi:FkbM family methyltransferase
VTFHSEHGQDQWLVENVFGDKRDGIFVEAGALDGLMFSNTLHFAQEKGWAGALIEGLPHMLGCIQNNRPESTAIGCALSDKFGMAHFEVMLTGPIGWSGLCNDADSPRNRAAPSWRRGEWVQTRALASVLSECGLHHVDYLSLDIEGDEFKVLSVFPFSDFDIDVIGIEDNAGGNADLRELLITNGYRHLARVGVDEMWRRI